MPYPIVWRKIFLCVFFFFSKLKFFHWWNVLMHTPLWIFFFFLLMLNLYLPWQLPLAFEEWSWACHCSSSSLMLYYSVHKFLFFLPSFPTIQTCVSPQKKKKKKCQGQCHLPDDYYCRVLRNAQFSHSVVSESLWPHGPQHARLPCQSPTPRAHSNSCPLPQWCHPTISSSVIPSPPAFNLSQHQGLFQWVGSLHQVAKVLECQLQHQSFQWTPRTDFL